MAAAEGEDQALCDPLWLMQQNAALPPQLRMEASERSVSRGLPLDTEPVVSACRECHWGVLPGETQCGRCGAFQVDEDALGCFEGAGSLGDEFLDVAR